MVGSPSRRGAPARHAGRALANLFGFVRDAVLAPVALRVPREWIALRLEHGVSEAPRRGKLSLASALPLPRPLPHVLETLRLAAEDPRVRGVFVKLGRAPIGWAKTSALARGFAHVRASGKRLVVHADSTGNAGAWLGGLADQFWMAPAGRLDLLGIRFESVFLRRVLDKLEIRPEVLSVGRYKSAGEALERESMSEPSREALEAVADDLYRVLVEGLASGRAGDAERARGWIDGGPYLASEAAAEGIVDELVYGDEIPQRLAGVEGSEPGDDPATDGVRFLSETIYRRLARRRFVWHPLGSGPAQIVVVPLLGLIRSGAGSPRGVVGMLRQLSRSDSVRAVILRVDSPGGDPLASDLIWRAASKLAEQKPVVASLGDRAASGGYYAAMAANEIVAEEATLTGSIGVVLAGLGFEGLLSRVGVGLESVERGKHAGIYALGGSRSEDERALLERQVRGIYDRFTGNAAHCRKMSAEDLEAVAEGRVWSGRQAFENKLVDHLGGLDLAFSRAEALAGLGPGQGIPVYAQAPRATLGRLLGADLAEGAPWRPQLWCPIRANLA